MKRRKPRLGVVVGEETWHFFEDVYRELRRHFQVAVFDPPGGFGRHDRVIGPELHRFLERQDVAFFEWASRMLALATERSSRTPIVTRLHRYELFAWADYVDWRRVHSAIFVSDAMRRKFGDTIPRGPAHSFVVPPGVSTKRFAPESFGLTYRIGTLAWLLPRKRIYELILAFAAISKHLPRLRLSIAGGVKRAHHDYYDACRSLVHELRLEDRVSFWGQPRRPAAWYRTVDIFVSNSWSEGLQVSLLEAMASGCHVLSHRWQGADDVLPESQLFLDDRDLERKIVEYYRTPFAARRRRQLAARETVERSFESRDIARRIRQIVAGAVPP